MLRWAMPRAKNSSRSEFTPTERAYIRRELDVYFSTLPKVADGFQLRTWRTGPRTGEPKVPPAAFTLVYRGLMRLDATTQPPPLFFTDAGIAALRQMMSAPRLADPVQFAHVRRELGIDPPGPELAPPQH